MAGDPELSNLSRASQRNALTSPLTSHEVINIGWNDPSVTTHLLNISLRSNSSWNREDNVTMMSVMFENGISGCTAWRPINHVLFQLANAALCVGLMAPDGIYGILFLHSTFVLGFLLFSVWAWVILCAPDFFSWNFAFMVINAVQMLLIIYHIRPIKFCDELEDVYERVFQPLRVPRTLFKKLVCRDYCTLMTLYQGECYATQSVTKTDKLGLLISGMLSVYSKRNFLHHICQKQFIDTPEFESSVTGDEKYQVSIVADTMCRYIFWSRHSLEYLMIKEPYLATVLSIIFGRDITNKLYALNEKVVTPKGSRLDIRLPSVSSSSMHSERDIRKTVARVSSNQLDETSSRDNYKNLHEDDDDDDDDDDIDADVFQENSEKVELLNGQVYCYHGPKLSVCSESSYSITRGSMGSDGCMI